MCAGNNDEMYIRARSAGEADYLLEESVQTFLHRYHTDHVWMADEIAQLRAMIAARRDEYALEAFERALDRARPVDVDQARALVEGTGTNREFDLSTPTGDPIG